MSTPLQIPDAMDARRDVPARVRPGITSASCRAQVAGWLLQDGAQIASGPHAGGVAGWLDAAGQAEYVYPEITGYYLHWLAWRAATGTNHHRLRTRAAAAHGWIGKWLTSDEIPATRVYVRRGNTDWRNGAVFFFDHAMLLRGLALADAQGLLAVDPAVVDRIGRHLMRLLAGDGMFKACAATQRGAVLPDRWSTRRGGFLAKAAAGVLIAAERLAIDSALVNAADATFSASVRWAIESPHSETHPFLYTVEGVLSIPDHPACAASIDALRPQLRALFDAVETRGSVPESYPDSGAQRMDVVAQALRVGGRLHAMGCTDIVAPATLRHLARRLCREVRTDGALPFDARRVPAQYNVWTAMFAEQALAAAHFDVGDNAGPRDTGDDAVARLPPALGLV